MNKIIIIVAIIVIVAIVIGTIVMTTKTPETIPTQPPSSSTGVVPAPSVGTSPSYANAKEANEIPLRASGTPPIVPTNPCSSYDDNSTNVSQECYSEIWKQAGCTNNATSVSNYNWAKGQSKATLINDSKAWATMTDDNHRKGCYGDNKSSWPASYIRYSSRNNFMSY